MEIQGQLRELRQLRKYLIKFLYCYIQQIADRNFGVAEQWDEFRQALEAGEPL